mmetsp:Transcript_47676/g.136145  ORF Transcript_47676/g.136145 Transcript_47676/m.136145 type:complete len:241 (-) Transcript_47676:502-1224(-)
MTKLRLSIGRKVLSSRVTLALSRFGTPKPATGLSCDVTRIFWGQSPLFFDHSKIFLSLISVKLGFSSRKKSTQSKAPSLGRPTGKSTVQGPSPSPGSAWTSSAAASCSVRQAKGSGARASGPKLTWTETFLKVTAGESALPSRASGTGAGGEARMPLQKRLMVLALGSFGSKFRSRAIVCPRLQFRPLASASFSRFMPWMKRPSASNAIFSGPSPSRIGEPSAANPTRRTCGALQQLTLC